jgi:hypothetical protein
MPKDAGPAGGPLRPQISALGERSETTIMKKEAAMYEMPHE